MLKKSLKIKAAIFDMDGVITNTMPDHYRAWKKIFKGIGINVSRFDIYKREGEQGLKSVREISTEHNKTLKLSEMRAVLLSKEILFKNIAKQRFIPSSRKLLHKLHKDKIRLALVTGTSRHELNRILPRPIHDLFETIVTGTDVKNGKPHPEPYLKAIEHLDIDPNHAIVFENAPYGIQSAVSAGLKCIALETSLPKEFLHQANMIFPSFNSLLKTMEFTRRET